MGIAKTEFNRMMEITKEETLMILNRMIEDWRKDFDIPPPNMFRFSVDKQDMLCLNDIAVCHIQDVNAADISSDPSGFFIGSNDRGYYKISIIWDYHNQIYIGEISLVLYSY